MRLTNKLAPKITIGVGDSSNDISMLENVDFPIVPQSIQYYISNTNKVIAPRGQVLSDVACDSIIIGWKYKKQISLRFTSKNSFNITYIQDLGGFSTAHFFTFPSLTYVLRHEYTTFLNLGSLNSSF